MTRIISTHFINIITTIKHLPTTDSFERVWFGRGRCGSFRCLRARCRRFLSLCGGMDGAGDRTLSTVKNFELVDRLDGGLMKKLIQAAKDVVM